MQENNRHILFRRRRILVRTRANLDGFIFIVRLACEFGIVIASIDPHRFRLCDFTGRHRLHA